MQGPSPLSRLSRGQSTGRACAASKAASRQAALAQHRRAGQAHIRQVLYWPQFLHPEDFATVVKECNKLKGKVKEEVNTIARGRLGCYVPATSPIVRILKSLEVAEALSERLSPSGGLFLSAFPVELRVMRSGSHMPWHKDEALYTFSQWECILTIANTSDSRTQYLDDKDELHEHWTEPNSLLAVQAEGWSHRVTPVKRGERTILKFAFTCTNAKLPAFDTNLDRVAYR